MGTLAHVYRVVMKYRGENFSNSELHGICYDLTVHDVVNYNRCLQLLDA